ncbi:TetR/AcrR family transcriptional regulator [Aquisalimonas asiatica]|uniref:Transcriptional regulator, TetR family n=1 Tax=Aquisalimonas asiatica TaxID=406100 RepID=A0A1H8VL36_9GAMM|nr:TetR/AcrR family transcriptional regulator [Aquisalimonas asiatica]SEP16053.1 transcriptional regulator, TetR family [Aquisalimonas asiatica]
MATAPGQGTRAAASKSTSTRARIRDEARKLFVSYGIETVTYGDIASRVGTTRANVHYHYGNKSALVKAVFEDTFERVDATLRAIWTTPGLTLDQRLERALEDARTRFQEFNDDADGRRPWSLSGRARLENQQVDTAVIDGIVTMSRQFEAYVGQAIEEAKASGELRPDAPVREIMLLITPLWYYGSPITQFSGMNKLEEHYTATRNVIARAYGAR